MSLPISALIALLHALLVASPASASEPPAEASAEAPPAPPAALVSTATAALAAAARDYHDGREEAAAATLEVLLERRPWDDDAAYWLARIRLDAGDCEGARALVTGRDGRNQPTWRFRTLEGMAAAACGDRGAAVALLQAGLADAGYARDQRMAQATLGVLLIGAGDAAGGAAVLAEVGGDPARVLSPALMAALPDAAALLAVEVLRATPGSLAVRRSGLDWTLDLSTGLLRLATPTPVTPPVWSQAPKAVRGEARPCGDGWIWVSPAEPLSSGEAGVFRSGPRGVERLERTPDVASDDSPFCAGDAAGWVRRIGGYSEIILLRDGERERMKPPSAVGAADAREVRGELELLLGLIHEGQPTIWTWQPGEEPAPLIEDLALSAPRWLR